MLGMKKRMKTQKDAILTEYLLFGSLIFLFLVTILFVTMMYAMRLERFLITVDAPSSSFFAFHISTLYFLFDHFSVIIVIIGIAIATFELKYKLKNKAKIRVRTLFIATLLTNVFTITYLIAVIHLLVTAIFCPTMEKMLKEQEKNPNESVELTDKPLRGFQ